MGVYIIIYRIKSHTISVPGHTRYHSQPGLELLMALDRDTEKYRLNTCITIRLCVFWIKPMKENSPDYFIN
jgi:hypothetical protein